MNYARSAVPLRAASYRRLAHNLRARASRLKHPAIRAELSALAADYERFAELEIRPFVAPWIQDVGMLRPTRITRPAAPAPAAPRPRRARGG